MNCSPCHSHLVVPLWDALTPRLLNVKFRNISVIAKDKQKYSLRKCHK